MISKQYTFYRQTWVVIFLILTPILIVAGFNFRVDPLQIYRRQSSAVPHFYKDQRFQNAGKLNSYLDEYEAIIIGHSHTDNFLPSKVQEWLGWGRVLKLTIDGGMPRELFVMASKALKKGGISHVLWGVGNNFCGADPFAFNPRRMFPDFLYTKSIMDDIPYLLSLDIATFSWELLTGSSAWGTDLETLNYWMTNRVKSYLQFNSKKNLAKLQGQLTTKRRKKKLEQLPEAVRVRTFPNIEKNLLPLIRNYPETQFVFFLPPPYYLQLTNSVRYDQWLGLQKTLVEVTAQLPNVRIYGFDDCAFIGGNAANYRDMGHYHSGVNQFVLKAFSEDYQRLTTNNFAGYEARVRTNILSFEIVSDFQKMIPMGLPQENETLRLLLEGDRHKEMFEKTKRLFKEKQFAAAVNALNMIVREKNVDQALLAKVHYYRGLSYMRMKQPMPAINDYKETIALNPNHAWAYADRGKAYLRIKDFNSAQTDFEKFISLKPKHFKGYLLLGRLKAKKGERKEAISLFSKAIELSPKRARLYIDRGKVYVRIGEQGMAQEDFYMARKLSPSIRIPSY